MKAIVLYESLFGNTALVAQAVAKGAGRAGSVTVRPFGEAPDLRPEAADLLVVGGPTHAWGMTRPRSRQGQRAPGYAVGAREWLQDAYLSGGTKVAVFDTRFDRPRWMTGSAARRIARELTRKGCRLVAPPESFFVVHNEGPLRDGEEQRAMAWGEELARLAGG